MSIGYKLRIDSLRKDTFKDIVMHSLCTCLLEIKGVLGHEMLHQHRQSKLILGKLAGPEIVVPLQEESRPGDIAFKSLRICVSYPEIGFVW
mmetsp:Transcript_28157/g.52808  ORF Transcript_28157/g.52808 Transcript_28157/m.52808 type:complete len:91 (-) Transcript_28157:202-474(-)